MATHYETLGVEPGATVAAIRAAYLAKARLHHPDRHIDAVAATQAKQARIMRNVNEAWSVLGDPRARAAYGRSLAAARATHAPPSAPRPTTNGYRATATARPPGSARVEARDDAGASGFEHTMRLLPMGLLLLFIVGIFVFTAFASNSSNNEPSTTTIAPTDLAAGACVVAGRQLSVVACSQAHDAEVVSIVAFGQPCPNATSVYTLDLRRTACLRPTP